MYFYVDFKIALDFPLFIAVLWWFFFFENGLSSGGIFFSRCFCRRCIVCVFIHLLRSSLVLFILGVLCLWGVSSGGPGHIFFCVGFRCVECRSVTIYLSACLEWVAGLYRFSSFGLCCVEYGTTYLSAGRGWVAGLYRFSSGIFFCLVFSKLLILF